MHFASCRSGWSEFPRRMDRGISALPISKVNKIIKQDKDVKLCSKEAIFLISKTTVRAPALPRSS